MVVQYFAAKDYNTRRVYLIGRFVDGLPERYTNEKWTFDSYLTSLHQDGKLEYISESEALKLIEERRIGQLQVA